jgi:hypothetical protein
MALEASNASTSRAVADARRHAQSGAPLAYSGCGMHSIILREYEELSYPEIAQLSNWNKKAVPNFLQNSSCMAE